ncbi:hypothetical protein [Nesterenkonia haasae]|uniref:hypothetical protein n=1 Tax=Nesterenkonia haasae TaxID=2587813 RepID=UPI0013914C69|nr:hypothetical protein [Nesterenkonia haasae]NDK30473.1 hypothetical protein [Nesterenkonia haasae]
MPTRSDNLRLRAAKGIYLGREGAPTSGDRWFSLYLIVFVLGSYVVPVAYAIGQFLDFELAALLVSPASAPYVFGALTLMAAVSLWVGRVQGPTFLTPYLAHTLLSTDISRRRVLVRPTTTSVLGIGLLVGGIVTVGVFALTQAGASDWVRFGLLSLTGGLAAVHGGLLAFLGQRLTTRWLGILTCTIAGLGGLGKLIPGMFLITPVGWTAALWAGGNAWLVVLLGLTATTGLVVLLVVPRALGRMPASRIVTQSIRLSEARLFTSTGNVNDAMQAFRAPPRHRFGGLAVGAGFPLASGLRQDFVTACRTPLSLASACVLIPCGAALLTLVVPAIGAELFDSRLVVTVPLAVAGALLMFFGTGGLTEGWRHLKNEFDASALFGWGPRTAMMRRLPWPVVGTIVLTLAGALPTVAVSMDAASVVHAVVWSLIISVAILCARFFQSMRSRDIPVDFLAPTVIPGGIDFSAVKILIWLGDGIIVSVTSVLALVLLPWDHGTLVAVLGGLVIVTVMWAWARTGQAFSATAPSAVSDS